MERLPELAGRPGPWPRLGHLSRSQEDGSREQQGGGRPCLQPRSPRALLSCSAEGTHKHRVLPAEKQAVEAVQLLSGCGSQRSSGAALLWGVSSVFWVRCSCRFCTWKRERCSERRVPYSVGIATRMTMRSPPYSLLGDVHCFSLKKIVTPWYKIINPPFFTWENTTRIK